MNKIKNNKAPLFFILPSFLGVSVFVFVPFLDVVRRSFTTTFGTRWIGFLHFNNVFHNKAFQLAAKNTGKFSLVCLPLLLSLSLFIALLLYKYKHIGNILKTLFLLPLAIPVASVALLWKFYFNSQGMLNGFLHTFGFQGFDWMDTKYAFLLLVLIYIWKNLGFNIVLWLAGLSSISPFLYEAAKIDGAGKWACFTKITLPNLLPTMFVTIVLSLVNVFKVFRESYLVAGDYPHESIYMMQNLFNNWFRDLALDKIAAGAVINAFVLSFCVLFLQKMLRNKGD